jgi:hypothetical protein
MLIQFYCPTPLDNYTNLFDPPSVELKVEILSERERLKESENVAEKSENENSENRVFLRTNKKRRPNSHFFLKQVKPLHPLFIT